MNFNKTYFMIFLSFDQQSRENIVGLIKSFQFKINKNCYKLKSECGLQVQVHLNQASSDFKL